VHTCAGIGKLLYVQDKSMLYGLCLLYTWAMVCKLFYQVNKNLGPVVSIFGDIYRPTYFNSKWWFITDGLFDSACTCDGGISSCWMSILGYENEACTYLCTYIIFPLPPLLPP